MRIISSFCSIFQVRVEFVYPSWSSLFVSNFSLYKRAENMISSRTLHSNKERKEERNTRVKKNKKQPLNALKRKIPFEGFGSPKGLMLVRGRGHSRHHTMCIFSRKSSPLMQEMSMANFTDSGRMPSVYPLLSILLLWSSRTFVLSWCSSWAAFSCAYLRSSLNLFLACCLCRNQVYSQEKTVVITDPITAPNKIASTVSIMMWLPTRVLYFVFMIDLVVMIDLTKFIGKNCWVANYAR